MSLWGLLAAPETHAATSGVKHLPERARQVVYEAQKALDKKQYEKARKLLQEYLEKKPDQIHASFYTLLGNAWYLDGHSQKAYEAYQKGYDMDSRSLSLCMNLAKTSYELKKYHEAGTLFEQAYTLAEKPDGELLYQAGAAYFQAKDYAGAKRVLERLFDSRVKMQKAWLELLIHTAVELKEWEEAEQPLLAFLEQNPLEADYWELLAQIRLKQEKYESAASALEIAYRIAPPEKSQWKELAHIYLHLNVPLQAIRCLEQAYGPNPSATECDELAGIYAKAQRMDQAVHYLDMALRQEPSASRYLEKAKLYYRHGLCREAMEALKMCLTLEPSNGQAHLLAGFCTWELGDIPAAKQALSLAAKDQPYRNEALTALEALEKLR